MPPSSRAKAGGRGAGKGGEVGSDDADDRDSQTPPVKEQMIVSSDTRSDHVQETIEYAERKGLQAKTSFVSVLRAMATTMMEAGRWEEALVVMERVCAIKKKADYCYDLAMAYEFNGHMEKVSTAWCERCVQCQGL